MASSEPTLYSLPTANIIDLSSFQSTLNLYERVIDYLNAQSNTKHRSGTPKDEFHRLDKLRYEELPSTLQTRRKPPNQDDGIYMTKAELQDAMAWKLKHGKFRPQLVSLIASNTEAVVKSTTKDAFSVYVKSLTAPLKGSASQSKPPFEEPLKILCKLRGVGPATASLLMSIAFPESCPFFSDELFRWACWDVEEETPKATGSKGKTKGKGKGKAGTGWTKDIKYDLKEYGMLWRTMDGLKSRLEKEGGHVSMVDLERVAFVCGRVATGDEGLKGAIWQSEQVDNDEAKEGEVAGGKRKRGDKGETGSRKKAKVT